MRTKEEIKEKLALVEREKLENYKKYVAKEIDDEEFRCKYFLCTGKIDAFNWILRGEE